MKLWKRLRALQNELYHKLHTLSYELYRRRNLRRGFGFMVPVLVRAASLATERESNLGVKGFARDNAHSSPIPNG